MRNLTTRILLFYSLFRRLIVSELLVHSNQEAPPSIHQFSREILRDFETQSRFSIVQQEFEKLKPHIRSSKEDAAAKLKETTEYLNSLVSKRFDALRNLVTSGEASANTFDGYDDQAFAIPQPDSRCQTYMKQMNESDVHFVSNSVEANSKSGVHITLESYQCDPLVMRDFDWTGTDFLEKTMAENKKQTPDMGHQYIGTYSGLTRMYPRRHWRIEPSRITTDLFDPRFRPWFVNTESVPKDIVFLIDYSGSVKGPTMYLIKITMMYILSTLNPNDYFFGVYFNSHFNPIISCSNRTFIPATTSNKKEFFKQLGALEEKDQAHFATPLKFSLDVLRGNLQSNQSLFSDMRSDGHKLLIIFTDGVDEWPHQILEEEFQTRNNELIRIFGYSMGYSSNDLPLQRYMSCKSHGAYSEIDSIMDVKPQSRMYLNVLSNTRGEELQGVKVEKRAASWTQLYMETQGLGPIVTLSMPILASKHAIWREQRLAGIAAIDISISELTKHLPITSDQMYGYIVDNNGILIHHPRLIIPKTEVHSVRRSACYDALASHHKGASGLRVQYGKSDERVYRLINLIDSIPTIDMYDLEGNSTATRDLRRRITTKTCHEEPIVDGFREYHCSHIDRSPFTIIIVNERGKSTVSYQDEIDVSELEFNTNKLVTQLYHRRESCDWKIDKVDKYDAYDEWIRLSKGSECDGADMQLSRAFSKATQSWVESWPKSDIDISCLKVAYPENASVRHYVNSFVHMRSKMAAFYPSCSKLETRRIGKKFEEEFDSTNNTENVQFSIRANRLLVYRTISDNENNRLAIVGTQWKENFFDEYFENFTRRHSDWEICKKQECSIVTQKGHVIASSASRYPSHLAIFDPQLFETLVKRNAVISKTWIDVQSECSTKHVAHRSSAAAGSSSILKHAAHSVLKILQTTFWKNLIETLITTASAQPSMTGEKCVFQKIRLFERCSIKHFDYTIQFNSTKQLQLTGMSACSRFARFHRIPNTTLSLVIANRACNPYKTKRHKLESEPRKLEMCDVVHSHARRKPSTLENWEIEKQSKHVDCYTDSSTLKYSNFALLVVSIIRLMRIFTDL